MDSKIIGFGMPASRRPEENILNGLIISIFRL
jgi:hypothetical protein